MPSSTIPYNTKRDNDLADDWNFVTAYGFSLFCLLRLSNPHNEAVVHNLWQGSTPLQIG